MKLLFLGTAAAEGIPALWCECELCRAAARNGGHDLRRRCTYLLDDDTLIDFGPDIFWQCTAFGIDLAKIRRIIVTHPHEDHLNPRDLAWRRSGYSKVTKPVKLFGGSMVMKRILQENGMEFSRIGVEPRQLAHGEAVADGDLEILPLNANQSPGLSPFIYVISRGGKKLLIGHDSGNFPEETWRDLKGIRLDAAVLEATMGNLYPDAEKYHLGIHATVRVRDRLREIGCIGNATPVYVTHFSHNGGLSHRQLEEFFLPRDITVAWDGLRCEI